MSLLLNILIVILVVLTFNTVKHRFPNLASAELLCGQIITKGGVSNVVVKLIVWSL